MKHQLSPRQIHLDFHTTELIPGIGKDFDADEFARMAKDASISSMTIFGRCHHGWMYFDSKLFPDQIHPQLANKNFMVDQIRALHKVGIKAPVYLTVQWDYHLATTRPEWLIRKADGSHEGDAFTKPGFYQSMCVNTGYADFLKAHVTEVIELLGDELDGFFFDIVGTRPCLCASCRKEMKELGIDASDETEVRRFATKVMNRFKKEMSDLIRSHKADCTIFYNAGHVGPCTKESKDTYSHFELESLPSGGWGYLHFPVSARYARKLGADALGMTGKFHTSWGDFHSLKNQAALEFEAYRMLSFGMACSIGDQMEPTGILNPATYRLIGNVYGPFAQREEWARPSVAMAEVAYITSESPLYEQKMDDTIFGAVQLLEELAVQFDVLDADMDINGYKVVILPDDFIATPAYQAKLDQYIASGGKVIACYHGGLNEDKAYPASFATTYQGEREAYPDFIIAKGELAAGLEEDNEYAIYLQGAKIVPNGAGKSALEARAPYFKREGDRFCSHFYTPSAKGEAYPAVTRTDNVIVFGHPLFGQYRQNASLWVKILIKNALNVLLPNPLVSHDGPSTMTVQLLDQPEKERVCAHILHYIPVRKSATIDIIEERTPISNITLTLNLPQGYTKARLVPENQPLTMIDGKVTIPQVDGYAIVEFTK